MKKTHQLQLLILVLQNTHYLIQSSLIHIKGTFGNNKYTCNNTRLEAIQKGSIIVENKGTRYKKYTWISIMFWECTKIFSHLWFICYRSFCTVYGVNILCMSHLNVVKRKKKKKKTLILNNFNNFKATVDQRQLNLIKCWEKQRFPIWLLMFLFSGKFIVFSMNIWFWIKYQKRRMQ